VSDTETRLAEQLANLKLAAVAEQYAALASEAAQKQWPHVDYLARLIESEAQRRHQLAIERRLAPDPPTGPAGVGTARPGSLAL
jgi:DNA replication protein DnaC